VLSTPCVTSYSSSLMIFDSQGLFWLSNASVARDSSSLMISESLGAVWAVEFTVHPRQQFVDDC